MQGEFRFDSQSRAGYLKLGESRHIARTQSLTDTVMIDYDELGNVCGVEILDLDIFTLTSDIHDDCTIIGPVITDGKIHTQISAFRGSNLNPMWHDDTQQPPSKSEQIRWEVTGGKWKLLGYDTFEGGDAFYHIQEQGYQPEYSKYEDALAAAKLRLRELNVTQPDAGGQSGMQDRVYIEYPDGRRERILCQKSPQ